MIRLHHCHQTRSMRTLWLLHELGVEFKLVIHPFDKALRAPDYLALHPVGRVPSLEIGGEVIWESGAITEVLCERFPEAGLGRLMGDRERTDWLIWVHFAESISQHTAALTQSHIVLYENWMRSPTVMRLETKRLGKCFEAVQSRLSDGRDHLLSSGFTAADICIGQAIYMGRHFVRLDDYPALRRWYARITKRPGFSAAMPPEGADLLYEREFYKMPEAQ